MYVECMHRREYAGAWNTREVSKTKKIPGNLSYHDGKNLPTFLQMGLGRRRTKLLSELGGAREETTQSFCASGQTVHKSLSAT